MLTDKPGGFRKSLGCIEMSLTAGGEAALPSLPTAVSWGPGLCRMGCVQAAVPAAQGEPGGTLPPQHRAGGCAGGSAARGLSSPMPGQP